MQSGRGDRAAQMARSAQAVPVCLGLLTSSLPTTQKWTTSLRPVKLLPWHTAWKPLQILSKYEWKVITWDHDYSIHFLQHWATPSHVPKHSPSLFGEKNEVFSPQITSGATLQRGLLIIVWVRKNGKWIAVQGPKQDLEDRNLLGRSWCFETESYFCISGRFMSCFLLIDHVQADCTLPAVM